METEDLDKFISDLKASNKLIIVEGIKDKKALNKLGIKNFLVLP